MSSPSAVSGQPDPTPEQRGSAPKRTETPSSLPAETGQLLGAVPCGPSPLRNRSTPQSRSAAESTRSFRSDLGLRRCRSGFEPLPNRLPPEGVGRPGVASSEEVTTGSGPYQTGDQVRSIRSGFPVRTSRSLPNGCPSECSTPFPLRTPRVPRCRFSGETSRSGALRSSCLTEDTLPDLKSQVKRYFRIPRVIHCLARKSPDEAQMTTELPTGKGGLGGARAGKA